MGNMPFDIHENAVFGNPLSPYFSYNEQSLRDKLDNRRVAPLSNNNPAQDYSQSRMRQSYEQIQRWAAEESYNRMGERMRMDKEAQLVDIYV